MTHPTKSSEPELLPKDSDELALALAEKIHAIYQHKNTQSSFCEVYNLLGLEIGDFIHRTPSPAHQEDLAAVREALQYIVTRNDESPITCAIHRAKIAMAALDRLEGKR